MDADVAGLSDAVLVSELRVWSARIAAGDAYVLRLVGELDAREAWAVGGVLSCAHWVSWQLGLSLATARDRVRVARALRCLPLLSAELAAGRLSYAQVRALVRVATPEDEAQWVELAQGATAAQLEKVVRGVGKARGDGVPSQKPAARMAWDEDGTLVLTLRISAAHAPAVLAALESAQQQEQRDRDERLAALSTELAGQLPVGVSAETPGEPEEPAPPYAEPYVFLDPPAPRLSRPIGSFEPRTEADQGLIAAYWVERGARQVKADAARAWTEHVERQATKAHLRSERATLTDGLVRALTKPAGLPPVTVKVLLAPLSGWGRTTSGELLPPMTLQQVLRTLPGRGSQQLRAAAPTRHDLGRRSRTVSPALRELLGQVDGERCRFPSCTRTRHLHAHHVRFWRDAGATDLANLVLVCSRHHSRRRLSARPESRPDPDGPDRQRHPRATHAHRHHR
ncbi:MAG: DUF222 domain-containing protein [Mycobacteriales bacterium]